MLRYPQEFLGLLLAIGVPFAGHLGSIGAPRNYLRGEIRVNIVYTCGLRLGDSEFR